MTSLVLVAPMEGWSTPLDEVPDAVFADRLLGDGVAIDPTGNTLFAPCDGEVIAIPAQHHAITLRAANGAQVLMHVGVDTVALGGEGFDVHVEVGSRVRAGDRLLTFDLDLLAERAKSLLTPIIITDEAPFSIARRITDRSVSVGEVFMELAPLATQRITGEANGGATPITSRSMQAAAHEVALGVTALDGSAGREAAAHESAAEAPARMSLGAHSARLKMPLEHGLHARPAALLVTRLKNFAATVTVQAHGKSANAHSAIALMSLGIRHNDDLTITAAGPDAAAALAAAQDTIRIAAGGHQTTATSSTAPAPVAPAAIHMPANSADKARSGASRTPYTSGEARTSSEAGVAGMAATGGTARAAGVRGTLGPATAGAHRHAPSQAVAGGESGGVIRGVVASPGLAVGVASRLVRAQIDVVEAGEGVAHENQRLDAALSATRARLTAAMAKEHGPGREVLAAHLQFLDDPELVASAREAIAQAKSAGFAWRHAIRKQVDVLRALPDARLAERADDLLDLESQVLSALEVPRPAPEASSSGSSHSSLEPHSAIESPTSTLEPSSGLGDPSSRLERSRTGHEDRRLAVEEGRPTSVSQQTTATAQIILLADELLPSQFVSLDISKVAGICLAGGGPTSHVAILAAAANIPMLVAAGPAIREIRNGTPLILDADNGELHLNTNDEQRAKANANVKARRDRLSAEREAAQKECRTADGTRIEIFANVGSAAEAHAAITQGAEGCGLLRTEFLFLDRDAAPDEATQAAIYSSVVHAFDGRPVIIRTLDTGGDKPLAYMPLPSEENPALGIRGVRIAQLHPDILRTQIRAIVSAQPRGRVRILLPMISEPGEVRAIGEMLDEIRGELGHDAPVQLGAMIETPAAAMLAGEIAKEADFLSIGTNDLTQYALAIDRGNPLLASQLDSLHPSVLRLIAQAARGARANHRDIAVCGSLASDPIAAPILIGLGITELSAVPAVVPRLKALIASVTLKSCEELAQEALNQTTAAQVRALRLAHL